MSHRQMVYPVSVWSGEASPVRSGVRKATFRDGWHYFWGAFSGNTTLSYAAGFVIAVYLYTTAINLLGLALGWIWRSLA